MRPVLLGLAGGVAGALLVLAVSLALAAGAALPGWVVATPTPAFARYRAEDVLRAFAVHGLPSETSPLRASQRTPALDRAAEALEVKTSTRTFLLATFTTREDCDAAFARYTDPRFRAFSRVSRHENVLLLFGYGYPSEWASRYETVLLTMR